MSQRTCPKCDREFESYKGYTNHFKAKHEGHPLVSLVGENRLAELYDSSSEKAISEALGVSRRAVKNALLEADISRRGQSEAESFKNKHRSEKDRREQTRAAREKVKEKYGDGGYLEEWIRENPAEHEKIAREAASLGTEARDQNGMLGVTGQDHPNWRGGKSVYDAVKRQLPGPSWNTVRDRHLDDRCANCGESDELELHHIVPILSGGTNEGWNLLTLCQSCHYRAEWVVRDLLDPVLLE